MFSVYGWEIIEHVRRSPRTRPARTSIPTRSTRRCETSKFPADMFGGDENTFSPTKHLGTDRAMLCQIQDGRWKSVSEYLTN